MDKIDSDIDLDVKRSCNHKDKIKLLSKQFPVKKDGDNCIKSIHLKYCPICHSIIDECFFQS